MMEGHARERKNYAENVKDRKFSLNNYTRKHRKNKR